MNKAIAIARVSSGDQVDDEHCGLPVQVEALKEYAIQNGFDLIEKPVEIVESAYKGKREKFYAKLKAIEHKVDQLQEPITILMYDFSRFSRRVQSASVKKVDDLRREGKVEVHFVRDRIRITRKMAPATEFSWTVLLAAHQLDSDMKSLKVREAQKYKVKMGQFPGYAPIGYLNQKGRIVLDPVRAPLVREAFELYATGNFSVEDLARKMAAKGLMTKGKRSEPRPIGKSDLMCILKNIFYTGNFLWKDFDTGERRVYDGKHEPLITRELFERVQKILSNRRHRTQGGFSMKKFFKYRGLLRCGYCGAGMTPQDMKRAFPGKMSLSGKYYRCNYSPKYKDSDFYEKRFGRNHSGVVNWKGEIRVNCPQRLWTEEEIDACIKEFLSAMTIDRHLLKQIKAELAMGWEERQTVAEMQKKGLEAEKRDAERLKKGLIRTLALSEFEEDIQAELREVKEEIERLEAEIRHLDESSEWDTSELIDMLDICQGLDKRFDTLSPMNQRRLVMAAFKEIRLMKGEVNGVKVPGAMDVVLTEPFEALFERWLEQNVKTPVKFKDGKSLAIIKPKFREG